jgi:hypothetical protein
MRASDIEEKEGSGLGYLLGGLAIGTVLGVLYAPRPGDETRMQVGDWVRRNQEKETGIVSRILNLIPFRVKAAGAMGAARGAGGEAFRQGKEYLKKTANY